MFASSVTRTQTLIPKAGGGRVVSQILENYASVAQVISKLKLDGAGPLTADLSLRIRSPRVDTTVSKFLNLLWTLKTRNRHNIIYLHQKAKCLQQNILYIDDPLPSLCSR
jgi:hypothetical protein